jgi:CRP/FNR family transcriptional regulator, cyclic AMP receptor protein
VLSPCRMAMLGRAFTARLAPYPEVTSALFSRAVARARNLAASMAIVHQPRIEVRLHVLFWLLADRWGTMHADGVHLPLRLTHVVLGELVAARRPSVTRALSELAARDAVRWTGKTWLLDGDPPLELEQVAAVSGRERDG